MKYPQQVLDDAKEMGFKAANKKFLSEIIDDINQDLSALGVKVNFAVPPQFVLPHSFIKKHLDNYAPEWCQSWQAFREALAAQENKRTLGEGAIQALKQCQQAIRNCFEQHPLQSEDLNAFLDTEAKYMVRSTGKEDATDRANPGGNESVTCVDPNPKAISNAATHMLLSNFEFKSIAQRLKYTQKGEELQEFEAEPFLPVLVDKMIGKDIDSAVYSGVIYSRSGCTRIQVAPGHGELIVNSLGNFDYFYITQDGRVYSEYMCKYFRRSPKFNKEQQKNTLQQVKNSLTLRDAPSIKEHVVLALHEFSKKIEEKYGMRMDIEFVYEYETNTVQVVQDRAIPLGDRRDLMPSSISPEKINDVKADESTGRGKVITPEVLSAVVINSPSEIIITPTIGEALAFYLKAEEEDTSIKAVIVQQDAPDTSHEAGEFSSKAIPVLQLDDIHRVEQQVEQLTAGSALVIAPQHKLSTIVTVPEDADAEDYLYKEEFLKEGIFRSAMSPYVSPQYIDFSVKEKCQRIQGTFSIGNLGVLVSDAKKGEALALNKLTSYLYNELAKPGEVVAKKFKTTDLKERLDVIPDITFGTKNEIQRKALSEVVAFLVLMQQGLTNKQRQIDKATYQQLMLTAGELLVLMRRAETLAPKQQTQLEYLNLFEKFNGLIMSRGKIGVLSNSVMLELQEKVAEKKALTQTPTAANLPKLTRDYFIQMSKVGHRIINENGRKAWLDFCRVIYGTHAQKEVHGGGIFAGLVNNLVRKGILDVWLNTAFLDAVEKCEGDARKVYFLCLDEYEKAFENDTSLEEAANLIDTLERHIAKWKDPNYFEKGFKAYQSEVEQLRKLLRIRKGDSKIKQMLVSQLLNRLVDVMDKSTKALENSTVYKDKQLQVARFKQVLEVFYGLMEDLIAQSRRKYALLDYIKNTIEAKQPPFDEKELSPSNTLNIVLSKLGGIGRILQYTKEQRISLEDIFTLMHKNCLVAVSLISKRCGLSRRRYPSDLNEKLEVLDQPILVKKGEKTLETLKLREVNSDFQYPVIHLNYNIPLANHSVNVVVNYNVDTQAMRVKVSAYGHNSARRWEILEMRLNYAVAKYGLKTIQAPYYFDTKEIVEFEVEISDIAAAKHLTLMLSDISLIASWMASASYLNCVDDHGDYFLRNDLDMLTHEALEELSVRLKKRVKLYGKEWQARFGINIIPLDYHIAEQSANFDINEFFKAHPQLFMIADVDYYCEDDYAKTAFKILKKLIDAHQDCIDLEEIITYYQEHYRGEHFVNDAVNMCEDLGYYPTKEHPLATIQTGLAKDDIAETKKVFEDVKKELDKEIAIASHKVWKTRITDPAKIDLLVEFLRHSDREKVFSGDEGHDSEVENYKYQYHLVCDEIFPSICGSNIKCESLDKIMFAEIYRDPENICISPLAKALAKAFYIKVNCTKFKRKMKAIAVSECDNPKLVEFIDCEIDVLLLKYFILKGKKEKAEKILEKYPADKSKGLAFRANLHELVAENQNLVEKAQALGLEQVLTPPRPGNVNV